MALRKMVDGKERRAGGEGASPRARGRGRSIRTRGKSGMVKIDIESP